MRGRGLPCPVCGCGVSAVIDTRPTRGAIRRRRECSENGHRFTTHEEVLVDSPPRGIDPELRFALERRVTQMFTHFTRIH